MLNITITEQTPHNMLRAIRAACSELLGDMPAERQILTDEKAARHVTEANCLSRYGQGGPLKVDKLFPVGEQEARQLVEDFREAHPEVVAAGQAILGTAFDKTVETVGARTVAESLLEEPAAGGAATAAVLDGLASTALAPIPATPETDSTGAEWNPELHASTKAKNQDGTWKKRRGAGKAEDAPEPPAAAPSLPPLPPAPPSTLVTMNDIYALITNGKAVLNDVIAAAQAMGFADVGAFSRDATPEQRAQLLAQLTAGADA